MRSFPIRFGAAFAALALAGASPAADWPQWAGGPTGCAIRSPRFLDPRRVLPPTALCRPAGAGARRIGRAARRSKAVAK